MTPLPPVRRWDDADDAAQEAYEAYSQTLQRKLVPVPTWHDLPMHEQWAWIAAVRATLAKAHRIMVADMITELEQSVRDNHTNLGIGLDDAS